MGSGKVKLDINHPKTERKKKITQTHIHTLNSGFKLTSG